MPNEPWLERLDIPHPSLQGARYGPAEEAVYADAIDALTAGEVPFVLGGAFALNFHTGIWRSTKDLDFFLRPESLTDAFHALERAGFLIEVVDPVWLAKAWKDEVFVDLIHANANGLFPVDDTWLEHAKEQQVFGRAALVAPAEEVILSKMFVAGRERYDGADILHFIYALRGDLDWERMLRKAGAHAGLLLGYLHHFQYAYPSSAGFIPTEVFDEAERLAIEGRAGAEFRGGLLDPIQFSVDVLHFGLSDERAKVREGAKRGPRPTRHIRPERVPPHPREDDSPSRPRRRGGEAAA